ncbi:hypothetical protein Tco_1483090 [Tanacetum coccineum]
MSTSTLLVDKGFGFQRGCGGGDGAWDGGDDCMSYGGCDDVAVMVMVSDGARQGGYGGEGVAMCGVATVWRSCMSAVTI